jgi:hypothetical protein
MPEQLSVTIGGEEFIADLLMEKAPRTIAATLKILPLESQCWHSGWLGDTLVVTPDDIPTEKIPYLEPENQTVLAARGDILWWPGQPALGIPYGEQPHLFIVHNVAELRWRAGYTPSNLWARINNRLDVLDQVGMNIGGGIYKAGRAGGGGARPIVIKRLS